MSNLISNALKKKKRNRNESIEEEYRFLFPKIGRDFVTKKDLQNLINLLIEELGLTTTLQVEDTEAYNQAIIYKNELENDDLNSSLDLVDMEDV